MKILVRLPNWLGDMVMSVAFIDQLRYFYPEAEVSVIAKKGIHALLPYFPPIQHQFIFSKEDYKGVSGLWKFGKEIKQKGRFDLFFCLPNSFSSALMGYATGSKKKVGYKNELRNFLFSTTYPKPAGLHRVEEYVKLLELFTGKKSENIDARLCHTVIRQNHIVVNINSEASSRRLTIPKAVELLTELRKALPNKIILIGAPKEKQHVDAVISQLPEVHAIENAAGKTSFPELIEMIASAKLMLTTDSGPAHLANALGTPATILFGAGNENNTAPYHKELRTIIRLGKLPCEPCCKNVCTKFSTPQCLEQLDSSMIVSKILQQAQYESNF